MIKYYKIPNAEIGKQISEIVYRIMTPEPTDVKYLFAWGIDIDGQHYIEVPVDMACPVFMNENFNTALSELSALLNVGDAEGKELSGKLKSGQVILGDIIPSSIVEYTPVLQLPKTPPFETT